MIKLIKDRVNFGGLVIGKIRAILAALAMPFLLVACANSAQSTASAPSKADWHEYVVYRIDGDRYISIRSPQKCDGYLDGDVYYNDIGRGVHTFVSSTGSMGNGLYGGYYAVRSSAKYIAIPSLSFSGVRGELMRINYSHDGGRTFQWFLVGNDDRDYAVIQSENDLYVTKINHDDPNSYSDRSDFVLNINQDMNPVISHYSDAVPAMYHYGKPVSRRQIPLNMKSPSGATHWTCPVTPKDLISPNE
ncbi:T6SS immunity protein Tli3 family protein [Burkholderia sp. LMG 21824]|uniref:T6SS immunity protein Tli3 family protein n=1 Tax=Burkholderia sp. LMG 21824 TaxID=3158172 RepID=UPI003C2CC622